MWDLNFVLLYLFTLCVCVHVCARVCACMCVRAFHSCHGMHVEVRLTGIFSITSIWGLGIKWSSLGWWLYPLSNLATSPHHLLERGSHFVAKGDYRLPILLSAGSTGISINPARLDYCGTFLTTGGPIVYSIIN